MADIFISYTKPDYQLATALARFFEAEGYTVWYDRDLNSGDAFSADIAHELATSRAVIVIWTQRSIISKWVNAEAARANDDRKLVPIKSVDIDYDDLPLPFNILHTENITNTDRILAAVIAQLKKPAFDDTSYHLLYKQLRKHAFTWFGIIGTVLTILSSLDPLLTLAYWCHVLISNWTYLITTFWSYAFSWLLPYKIPPFLAAYLSASLCLISLAIGSRLKSKEDAVTRTFVPLKTTDDFDVRLVYMLTLLFCIHFVPEITKSFDNNLYIFTSIIILSVIGCCLIIMSANTIAYYRFWRNQKRNISMWRFFAIFILGGGMLLIAATVLISFIFVGLISIIICYRLSPQSYLKTRLIYAFELIGTLIILNYMYIYFPTLTLLLQIK